MPIPSFQRFHLPPASNSSLLVTGGAGYIGTHTLLELIRAGYQPVVLDDFSNGSHLALKRVESLAGHTLQVVEGSITDTGLLDAMFSSAAEHGSPIQAVVHFAGLKSVGESVAKPLDYYQTNVAGTLTLLQAMERAHVHTIVFSSSATVYGIPLAQPYTESHPIAPVNPYGSTKAIVEQILRDWCAAHPAHRATCLRYFNPIGAHPSGMLGEAPEGIPNNLFPFITQVAVGKRPHLNVFGNDYPTVDGTGVRDYIHVVDLAIGHVKALEHSRRATTGFVAINLGTGRGTSVLELLHAFQTVSGQAIPYEFQPRRPGDIAECWADPSTAEALLGWKATRTLEDMCADGWRWQSQNPNGYEP
ncbi:UDP-glucose 4-epimerase GalE [Pigmentiphaga sp. YJ18]|uniref:UDP-glucose 4-epimerase GalE n=1 Tax=Pigmentiphaga sp. YJ18 TaxID=3134907 RepID=UPI003115AF5B